MLSKLVSIKQDPFGRGYSVMKTENGRQWSEVFSGNHISCVRIAKSYMKEGYKEAPGEDIKSWFG